MTLYRVQLKVEQQLNQNSEKESMKWTEFVYDLWEKHLPHFWEEIYAYGEYLPPYGFQEENAEDGTHEFSMAGLSRVVAEEVGQDMETSSLVISQPTRLTLKFEDCKYFKTKIYIIS